MTKHQCFCSLVGFERPIEAFFKEERQAVSSEKTGAKAAEGAQGKVGTDTGTGGSSAETDSSLSDSNSHSNSNSSSSSEDEQ